MFTNRNLVLVITALVVVIVGAKYLFTKLGQANGEAAKERLMLVWPDYMRLEPRDRALLGSLAITCRVEEQPMQEVAVIDCLRKELASSRVILPTGLDQKSATERFNQLISERR